MNRRVFVTGTDTEIGKTVLSGLLCCAWGARYWKPIQSGLLETTDSQTMASWIGEKRVLPEGYRLTQPLSPHLSARLDGQSIELDALTLPEVQGPLVVEGAGGILVPLNERAMMIDLMVQLGLPVVVAARSTLGTINHTCMTLALLREQGLTVAGVVLIGPANAENEQAIARYGSAPIWGRIPPMSTLSPKSFLDVYHASFDGLQKT